MQSDFLPNLRPTDALSAVSVGFWGYSSDEGVTLAAPPAEPRCSCSGPGGPPTFRKCQNWIESFNVNKRCGLIWPRNTDIPEFRPGGKDDISHWGPLVSGPPAPRNIPMMPDFQSTLTSFFSCILSCLFVLFCELNSTFALVSLHTVFHYENEIYPAICKWRKSPILPKLVVEKLSQSKNAPSHRRFICLSGYTWTAAGQLWALWK